jgi:ABC-type cobalamin/Fe3+-siderophores transport system ATPase subunit
MDLVPNELFISNRLGKTTLVRLLAMIDKPTEGEIHINDHKMSDYNPKVLYANMSVLFQDFRILPPLLI